jgi:hypothetical protein
MEHPFDSARLHLELTLENIRAFDDLATEFIHPNNWTGFTEFNPETGQHRLKARFKTGVPPRLAILAKRVFGDLRDSLDHALYSSARLTTGKPDPKRCKYPFGPTPAEAEAEIFNGKCDDLHPDVLKIVIASAPYEAGNRTLWAMNKVRNRDTHSILSPASVQGHGFRISFAGAGGVVLDSTLSEWRSTRNELTYALIRLDPDAQIKIVPELQISLDRAFGFGEATAVSVFEKTLSTVTGLVNAIEEASLANVREK